MSLGLSFDDLVRWRRDVRRFRTDPVSHELLEAVLALADLSPSVGNSQPWRVVEVRDPYRRDAVRSTFNQANSIAAELYDGDQAALYRSLKLAGFDAAPVHIAVFCDAAPEQGAGLGRQSMPEMLPYSCVSFVMTLWYAARARGLGLGWVSIVDPDRVAHILDVPAGWSLIGYLLLGWPEEETDVAELQLAGWQERTPAATRRFVR